MTYRVLSIREAAKLGYVELDEYRDECFGLFECSRLLGTDGGSPEDQTFLRKWSWVVTELEHAYARGQSDGYAEGIEVCNESEAH